METFKTEVARLSGGSAEVEVVTGSPLGLKEIIDAVYVGKTFGTWVSIGYFSRLIPEIEAVSLPFIFENYDEAWRGVVTSPAGSLISRKLDAKGFTLLAWMEMGAMHVTNSKRPIKTLDDFKGLSIRVLPNATHLATFRALGARPVTMDLKDVGAALRQGDVDGEEQDYALTYANKYYESQKYITATSHFLDFTVLVANKKAFSSLDPMQQKAIREAAAITTVQQRKISTGVEETALQRLKETGMQFDQLSPAARVALRRATATVINDVRKWAGAEVVDQVLTANRLPAANVHR
jgi:tripartite ATP-independent transporter DctP family solute receptor